MAVKNARISRRKPCRPATPIYCRSIAGNSALHHHGEIPSLLTRQGIGSLQTHTLTRLSKSPASVQDDWDAHWTCLTEMMRINPAVDYRWKQLRRLMNLDSARRDTRLLDIGCGEGSFIAHLHATYPSINFTGIDSSAHGLQIASRRLPTARFECLDLLDSRHAIPEELNGWATHAVCSEVLEHLDDPVQFLLNARILLAPGSVFVCSVPAGPMSSLDHYVGHRKHYTRSLLTHELQSAGYKVDRVCCAGFPFHSLYRLLVVVRGRAIVTESTSSKDQVSLLTRTAMECFRLLFHANATDSPFGWQILARATLPSTKHTLTKHP